MIKTLYLIHHSHTDLGYTHPQPVVRHLHVRYIDAALREIERTLGYPQGARMKWTCETLYPVFDWLAQASSEDRERFTAFEREGLMEVTASWSILTQSCPPRAWQWMLDRLEQARGEYGFTIRSAMLSDINGVPWTLPDRFVGHGVSNFSMSINEHFGKSIFPRLKPFRWRGPQGAVLKVFNGLHYNNNQYFGIPYDLGRASCGVEEFQAFLDAYPGFDLDFAVFQVTRPDFNDNGAPDPRLPEFVAEWNRAGLLPRMEIVTLSGFFDAIGEGFFDRSEERAGEWTDFWNFGAASTPYETALNRRAYSMIGEVESLEAAGARTPEISGLVSTAIENAVFHDEHTWGADCSVATPHVDAARAGLHFKNDFAFRAHTLALLARAEALSLLIGKTTTGTGGQHLLLANPAQSARRCSVDLPVAWLLSDVCPTPTHLHRMQMLPVSWPPVTVPLPARTAPEPFDPAGDFRLVLELKAGEVRSLSADEIFASAIPSRNAVRKVSGNEARIENDCFTVTLDPVSGGIASLVRKSDGRELLALGDSPNGVPVRESPTQGSRRDIHPTPDWTRFMGYKGWATDWKATREPASPGACRIESSAGRITLRRDFSSPQARGVSLAVTLDDVLEAVGFEIAIDFRWCADPCAWYWPLTFALHDPLFTYDNCGVPVRLGLDQLPGANADYQTVHRWVRISGGAESMLLFPLDTPIICLGGFNFGRMTTASTPRRALAAPMLHSNYWDTNYAASCDGTVNFRFFLAPGNVAPSPADADRLADELAHPAIAVPFSGSAGHQERFSS